MDIRSFRRVFRLDRRLYAIGDWTIPVPSGIPLRGAVYFVALAAVSLITLRLPVIGLVWGVLPVPIRHVLIPLWLTVAGMMVNPDGRRTDQFLASYLAWQARRLRDRLARVPDEWNGRLRVRWDEHDTRLHRARIKGPATVRFRAPVSLQDRWDGWCAEHDPDDGEARTVEVRADQTLLVRP